MSDYDSYQIVICKRTDSPGSINVIIGRRLPHGLFSFSVFLVDLWKLGLKDAWGWDRMDRQSFEDTSSGVLNDFDEMGIDFQDIDISDAKEILSSGMRIAKAVGTPSIKRNLLETAGNLDESKIEGSLYKCYECEKGELSEEDCEEILRVAKKELKLGVSGTPMEEIIHFECISCKTSYD